MKRLIYQVYLPIRGKSKLYDHCTQSVQDYCKRHGIEYYQLTEPKLKINPDMDRTNRNKVGLMKEAGYLPIFEKEYAWTVMREKGINQCAVIDADIYIRPDAPNIFDELGTHDFAGVLERDMPLSQAHRRKIQGYAKDMFKGKPGFDWTNDIADFYNMGMMLMNDSILEFLNGQTPEEFIHRPEFKDFVDGIGLYKYSTDQVLLNCWMREQGINTKNLDWKWNGMYKGVDDAHIRKAYFVHFFLKEHLPNKGENVEELMRAIK